MTNIKHVNANLTVAAVTPATPKIVITTENSICTNNLSSIQNMR